MSMERLTKKVTDMKKNKRDWQSFLELPYNVPVPKETNTIKENPAPKASNEASGVDLHKKEEDYERRFRTVNSTLKETRKENKHLE